MTQREYDCFFSVPDADFFRRGAGWVAHLVEFHDAHTETKQRMVKLLDHPDFPYKEAAQVSLRNFLRGHRKGY